MSRVLLYKRCQFALNKTKKSNIKVTLFCFINFASTLVERIGIEPMTFCLQSRCSPS